MIGLKRDNTGVALLYNQRNLVRWSKELHSLGMVTRMLDDLGIQHDFISSDQVTNGILLERKPKVLILAGQICMDIPTATAIREYVKNGGAVVTDKHPASNNGVRTYEKRLLDDLFAASTTRKGPMPPSNEAHLQEWRTHWNEYGKGKTLIFGNYPTTYGYDRMGSKGNFMRLALLDFLNAAGVTRAARLQTADRTFQPLSTVTYHDGNNLYVAIQREYGVLDQSPRDFVVNVPRKAHVYDVLKAKYLGLSDSCKIKLDVARGRLIAFLNYRAETIAVDGLPQSHPRGQTLTCRLILKSTGNRPAHGVFRIETMAPSGETMEPLCQNLRWDNAVADLALPIAFNDPAGKWTLRITDIATGTTKTVDFTLK